MYNDIDFMFTSTIEIKSKHQIYIEYLDIITGIIVKLNFLSCTFALHL